MANTFEAFIGALFLDQGAESVGKVLQKHLFPKAKELIAKKTLKDPKSLFQELVQEQKLSYPVYRILKTEGPEHAKVFTTGVFVKDMLWGEGIGQSKQEAEQEAARLAIEKFGKD